ncbi:hypothetical protein V1511DRAFT_494182 [Dipodascopsis uninucleata]
MSVPIKRFAGIVGKWPEDAMKRQVNLKETLGEQLQQYQSNKAEDLPKLKTQIEGAEVLLADKYKKLFPVSDKLMRPSSNPKYYEDLQREMIDGQGQGPSLMARVKIFFTG